jgi:RNA polymerase sigma factor (sigma-70 family)
MSEGFWCVPVRTIRTQAAQKKAVAVVNWIQSGQGLKHKPEEQALFEALHTCAYVVNRTCPRAGPSQRACWVHRWNTIREYIVERNLGLVYSTIRRFRNNKVDEDDLLSDAMLALSRAIDRYDPWKGFRFSTYACNVILRAIMRRRRIESRYRQVFPVQYEAPCEWPEKDDLFQQELYVERLKKVMARNLGSLTERESEILTQRFSNGQKPPPSFQQIADTVGLSKERVRQIQNSALHKLRRALNNDPVLKDRPKR